MPEQRMVHAYDTTTGQKLRHLVPVHFVEPGSPFPHLAEQPSHREDRGAGIPRNAKRADLEAYAVTAGITAQQAAGYDTKADLTAAIEDALNGTPVLDDEPDGDTSDDQSTDDQSGSNAAGQAGATNTEEN